MLKRTRKELLDMVRKYKYQVDIAKHMGVTRERVRQLLNLYRIPFEKKSSLGILNFYTKRIMRKTKIRNNRIKALYKMGLSCKSLSDKFGICPKIVSDIVTQDRMKYKKYRNEQIVKEALRGRTQKNIAADWGLHQSQVCHILNCNKVFSYKKSKRS